MEGKYCVMLSNCVLNVFSRDVEGQLCYSLNLTALKNLPKPDQGRHKGNVCVIFFLDSSFKCFFEIEQTLETFIQRSFPERGIPFLRFL